MAHKYSMMKGRPEHRDMAKGKIKGGFAKGGKNLVKSPAGDMKKK